MAIMDLVQKKAKKKHVIPVALLCLNAVFSVSCASAQEIPKSLTIEHVVAKQQSKFNNEAYILGPGDNLEIELVGLQELSGTFSIGPDGTIYLPRLRALHVEGLTIDELQALLTKQFRTYVIDPQVYIRPVSYRPIRVYVGGEVKRPGYYTLSGNQNLSIHSNQYQQLTTPPSARDEFLNYQQNELNLSRSSITVFPTIFDAVQSAQG